MRRIIIGFISACLVSGNALALSDEESVSRGRLLYENHCGVCHTSKIHQREKRAAKNLDGIRFQVNRWQTHLKLQWNQQEIADVANFVNDEYYHYSE